MAAAMYMGQGISMVRQILIQDLGQPISPQMGFMTSFLPSMIQMVIIYGHIVWVEAVMIMEIALP